MTNPPTPEQRADMFSRHRERTADYDEGPYVCPGCYAMGAEPHAGYCPDAAIEREREERFEREGYEDDDAAE